MLEFTPLLAMAALVYQVVAFLRFLRGKDVNGALTIVTGWAAGLVAVLLVAQTDFANGIGVGDQTLATLNFASQVFVGLTLSSLAGFGNDVLGAVDQWRSTAKPRLVDGERPLPPPSA